MKKKGYFLSAILFLTHLFSYSQTLNGYVKDYFSGENLVGVNIIDSTTSKGVITNQYGFFSLKVIAPMTLYITHFGYQTLTYRLTNLSDTVIIFEITPIEYQLNEVIIKSLKDDLSNREIGYLSIPIERLNSIPAIFGEKDVFKALALTPGISNGNEGTVGLYVRGGTPDQNLILLDEAPIYNASHFFGLFSVFNSDALKKIDIYKGSIPAQYGGRISSVLDVTMKEGANKYRKRNHGIGLISSNISFEGPLSYRNKEKGSYIVSGRAAYLGLLTLPTWFLYQFGNSQQYFNYLLYDLNAKINYKLDVKSHLYLSLYNSYDRWDARQKPSQDVRTRLNVNWGNLTSTIRYNRIINPNLFLKSVFLFTKYRYSIGIFNDEKLDNRFIRTGYYRLSPSLNDITLKTTLEYSLSNSHTMKVGSEITRHLYKPTRLESSLKLNEEILKANNTFYKASEIAAFAENSISLKDVFYINLGLRLVAFSVQDKTYTSFEPRLSNTINLPNNWLIKSGYSQMKQFIHLLNSNSIGLPNDVWVPATANVPPQFVRQFSLGVFKNYPSRKLILSIEGYYKFLKGQIDYRTGSSLFAEAGTPWESLIEVNGIGESSGLELFVNKTEGVFTGWIAYTLAWNKRKFDNINKGEWFYANFDRRHTINLTGNYKLSQSFNISSNWVFNTGHPITVPVATIFYPPNPLPQLLYGNRNNFRMPNYHRLDVGINWDRRSKRNRTVTWSVGAYNIYNRINPYYVEVGGSSLSQPTGTFDRRLFSYGFIPIIPYIGYVAKM